MPPPAAGEPIDYSAASRTEAVRAFYENAPVDSAAAGRGFKDLLARYYRHFIPPEASVLEIGCGSGELLARLPNTNLCGVDLSARQIERARARLPHGRFCVGAGETLELDAKFDIIILSETLNQSADVQRLFEQLHHAATARTRLIFNYYSGLWRPLLGLAERLGLKGSAPPSNWLGHQDVANLCELADWQILRRDARILWPLSTPILDPVCNRYIAPLLPWACLTVFGVAWPRRPQPETPRSVTVVVPARNEAGNIEAAVQRTPPLGTSTELIFIEGHSVDETWAEIQRVVKVYPERKIRALRQTGRGKGNAVREAFAAATGDILMILDADLTVPPEELPKFYSALACGRAEFANGVRLVYPMEERAMRFLNFCANKCFSIAFSWLLGQPVKDTLCGTKVLFRSDYEKIAADRSYFGEFDPFGDFDLLFGADKLSLKIADIPIRYRERTYGTTNIQRWSQGWLLLRMVAFAARKLKFI